MPSPPAVADERGLVQMDAKVPRWLYDYVHAKKALSAGRRSVKDILGELAVEGYIARFGKVPDPKPPERL